VAKALVSDLDLEVFAPHGTHHCGNQGLYADGQCMLDGEHRVLRRRLLSSNGPSHTMIR